MLATSQRENCIIIKRLTMRNIKQFHAAQLMYTIACSSNLRSELRHVGQYVMPFRHIPIKAIKTHATAQTHARIYCVLK